MDQNQIDDFVEHFYQRLIQDPYYVNLFKEKNVDLEQLKQKQREFIARLVGNQVLNEHSSEVEDVQERHSFQITRERADVWFRNMEETMNDLEFEVKIKIPLLEKVAYLLNKITV